MPAADRAQIYLLTPPAIELAGFPGKLARVLDGAPVACLRLALATRDEDALIRAADSCREVAHARDVPVVIEAHVALAGRLGLDGVHLADGARGVRKARAALGREAIVGAFCGTAGTRASPRPRPAPTTSPSARPGRPRWARAGRRGASCSPGGRR